MQIIRQLAFESSQCPVDEVVAELINKMPKAEVLKTLRDIISNATYTDEQIVEIVHTAWSQIQERQLWEGTFDSLEQLEQVMNYTKLILPIVQHSKKTDRQKLAELKSITTHWHLPMSEIFPTNLWPNIWSRSLLLAIRNLAERVPKSEEVVVMIRKQVERCLSRSSQGRQVRTTMTLRDVQEVIQEFFQPGGRVGGINGSNRSNEETKMRGWPGQ
ncbi:MAG: hypothetical protein M1840_006682 [Geoglossum simile]|nr:MAG: hypothetical protein M1840_006682 [Geoglossum simile]